MNTQEIFDKVACHLLTQNAKAEVSEPTLVGSVTTCRYRVPDGKRCAVGCLITDSFYAPELEGALFVSKHMVQNAVARSIGRELWSQEYALLSELQSVHDTMVVVQWPTGLRTLAEAFGLNPAVVEEFAPSGAAEGGV
jgi:hypothetical protein